MVYTEEVSALAMQPGIFMMLCNVRGLVHVDVHFDVRRLLHARLLGLLLCQRRPLGALLRDVAWPLAAPAHHVHARGLVVGGLATPPAALAVVVGALATPPAALAVVGGVVFFGGRREHYIPFFIFLRLPGHYRRQKKSDWPKMHKIVVLFFFFAKFLEIRKNLMHVEEKTL